ncbi:MAG: SRPBCC domain-containing protein [Polyangiaceae bacterium]|nr:SRPBCC domain-containing protein [Polyangiaceae bacterium]
MKREQLELSIVLSVEPERLYAAWLDAGEHSAFTGGAASVEAWVGGRHTAWDGYIEGEILALEPGRRIVQSWRTTDFTSADPDSRLEISFQPEGRAGDEAGETRLTLHHAELPPGGAERYTRGWQEFYFDPMRAYFSAPPSGLAPESAAADAGAAPASPPARRAKKVTKVAGARKAAGARAPSSRAGARGGGDKAAPRAKRAKKTAGAATPAKKTPARAPAKRAAATARGKGAPKAKARTKRSRRA